MVAVCFTLLDIYIGAYNPTGDLHGTLIQTDSIFVANDTIWQLYLVIKINIYIYSNTRQVLFNRMGRLPVIEKYRYEFLLNVY